MGRKVLAMRIGKQKWKFSGEIMRTAPEEWLHVTLTSTAATGTKHLFSNPDFPVPILGRTRVGIGDEGGDTAFIVGVDIVEIFNRQSLLIILELGGN